MSKFRGVFPAHITPLTSDGKLNESAFREVMEFNIRSGVHGFWIAGGTGESVYLNDEENMRIAEISADQNRGRVQCIMHVGAANTARAAALAEHAASAGVEAICCVPPFFYSPGDEAVVEHYRVVGSATDLPLFVYNLPSSTGVDISVDLMKRVQDSVPQLSGLKHSSPHFSRVRDFADMGLDCFIGSAYLLLPGMTIGACGMIDGPPNAAPELWVDVWNAYESGDYGRAQKAQRTASRFASLTSAYPFPAGYKTVLSRRLGIECGDGRPPNLPLSPSQKAELLAGAEAMGIGRIGVVVEAAGND